MIKNYSRIFGSKLHTRLIIEAQFFCPQQEQGQYMKLESQITNIEAQRKSRLFGNQSSLIDNQSKRRSTTVENSLQITPFYAKQSQFTKGLF